MKRDTLIKRFLKKVNKTESCWNWVGWVHPSGYGYIKHNNKGIRVHRLSYEIYIGNISNNICVCHKCNNKKCVNPEHLYLSTIGDNVRDAQRDGLRNNSTGEKHWSSKIKDYQRKEIFNLFQNGISQKYIASIYNVSQSSISYILNKYGYYYG